MDGVRRNRDAMERLAGITFFVLKQANYVGKFSLVKSIVQACYKFIGNLKRNWLGNTNFERLIIAKYYEFKIAVSQAVCKLCL